MSNKYKAMLAEARSCCRGNETAARNLVKAVKVRLGEFPGYLDRLSPEAAARSVYYHFKGTLQDDIELTTLMY